MQPNQVPKRSVPSSELFNKTPTDNPESQQEQWLPAVPLVGEVLQALAPSTWKLHPCTCTSIRKLKVFLLSSLNIPKSPATDWGLSLTERRRAFHLPDGFRSPHQGSSHSLPAPSQTGQLFKQLSVSFLSFQLFLLREAQVILIIKFNLLIVFFGSVKKPEIDNFSHRITKKGHNQQYSSWLVQSWVIDSILERDLMSTFGQMPRTPRYLQPQIHQTLQLTHPPPSVPSLQLCLYLSEKHRGKPKAGVNENKLSG